jgi:hypothetical protein
MNKHFFPTFSQPTIIFSNFTNPQLHPIQKNFQNPSSSSKFPSMSMNFTKLEGDFQPILGTIGQFLLTNINFYKKLIVAYIFLNL